ncbi:Putative zn(2)-C6 fungal-type DNA-binding domain-containing protein [Septoria linicola]|uniref:Zn(2)-C6 fungal-type DNA-binding domain-containing protein n=1 Tax=Septoria linicola TaxID=215465 RepID=A0A9Q9EIX6_9PEZI|nr:putative zn(2)-C6 fungal-type DNA-binding domain-containing protein [Septoria linicola]USW50793.1 Putative zn(2)-C6 fungal-type DNA-binding domain-containing protein [Septoria linicola]
MDSAASTVTPVAAVTKRKTIIAACQFCRSKKFKCDGKRPCDQCSARHRECTYFTAANETRQQSVKRKYEEVNQAFHDTNNLIRALMSSKGNHAHAVLDLLRAGHSPAEIVSHMQGSPVHDAVSFTYEQRLQRKALICICQSSCDLEDL